MDEALVHGYLDAKLMIIEAGYEDDVAWAESLAGVKPDALYVMREAAWVIVNSGFRYQVVQHLWPQLSEVFHHWDHTLIDEMCVPKALAVLNHSGKVGAIVKLASILRREGPERIVAAASNPPELTRLPWIGKITCWHLAKLLGADVVKPDVHLQRAAKAAGYSDPLALAKTLQEATGESLTVVDSVLWRYGEQQERRRWPSWDGLFNASPGRGRDSPACRIRA